MSEKPSCEKLEQRVGSLEKAEAEQTNSVAVLAKNYARLERDHRILEKVLENTHMMAVFLDSRFNFVWVNRAYADTCRHEASFFKGKNHFDLYPHKENQAIFQRVVDSGEPFFIEAKPFEFPDQPERGVTYWDWSLIPTRDAAGKVSGMVFSLTEVTERVRAEERVRHEYGMRVTLLDNIPDCFALILKKHTREIVASNKLAKVNGATPDKKCYEVFAKRDDPCPFCMAPTLWATGEPQKAEVAYRGGYFRGIWVPFTADIYIHYIFDITERKRAEMERKELIADLQTASRQIKTLEGIIPICTHCKNVRDDQGYWQRVEKFVRDRSSAQFSHGICPDCQKKHYADIDFDVD